MKDHSIEQMNKLVLEMFSFRARFKYFYGKAETFGQKAFCVLRVFGELLEVPLILAVYVMYVALMIGGFPVLCLGLSLPLSLTAWYFLAETDSVLEYVIYVVVGTVLMGAALLLKEPSDGEL